MTKTFEEQWREKNQIRVVFDTFDGQKCNHLVHLTPDDVDKILYIGIMYGLKGWCSKVDILGDKMLGTYVSDQVSRGGYILVYDKFCKGVSTIGLKSFLEAYCEIYAMSVRFNMSEHCNDGYFYSSPRVCDYIIQYAVFGGIKYPHTETECEEYEY